MEELEEGGDVQAEALDYGGSEDESEAGVFMNPCSSQECINSLSF